MPMGGLGHLLRSQRHQLIGGSLPGRPPADYRWRHFFPRRPAGNQHETAKRHATVSRPRPKQATKSEELLAGQLEQVNERLQARSSHRLDRAAQAEALQDELQVLARRKQDLERRLKLAQGDQAKLAGRLEEAADKAAILEELLDEKERRLGELALEIGELRDSSGWLSARLESMISLNELLTGGGAGAELRALSERERSQLAEQLRELRLKRTSRIKATDELLLRSQRPSQRRKGPRGAHFRRRPAAAAPDADDDGRDGPDDEEDGGQYSSGNQADGDEEAAGGALSSDLMSQVFAILSDLQAQLLERKERLAAPSAGPASGQFGSLATNGRANANGTPDDSGIGTAPDEAGEELARWRRLVEGLRQLIEELPCSSCHLMIGERADYEQLKRLQARLCDELRLKEHELLRLAGENIEQRARLAGLEERAELLQADLAASGGPPEELVQLAWRARDQAVERKNGAEIQLARARIENMQVSGQLMEVVRQKGELSQKLAQFEDDIHLMMQRSVRARFSWEELADESRHQQQEPASGLQQLLSLSSAVLLSPKRTVAGLADGGTPPGPPSDWPAGGGGGGAAANNLLASLKSGRFSLRFWQRAGPQHRQAVE